MSRNGTPACFTEALIPPTYALNRLTINHGLSAQVNLQADGANGQAAITSVRTSRRSSLAANSATPTNLTTPFKFDRPNSGVSIPIAQFPSVLTNNNYYGGAYHLGPNPAFKTFKFADANPSQFTTVRSQGTDTSNYDLVEKVISGYLMNTVDLSSKFRLVAGVRLKQPISER